MTNNIYINSKELDQFKNQLQAVFDNTDIRNDILKHVENDEEKSLIPYLDNNFIKIYVCDFDIKRRLGHYGIDKDSSKGKYDINHFSFSLDSENNIFMTRVIYHKRINNKISIQLDIQSDNYRKEISDLAKADNNCFKAKNVVFKIFFEENIFAVLKNNDLFFINDYNLNYLKKFGKYKKGIEFIELFQYLNKYDPINAFQILQNEHVALSHEKLDLYHLESDKKLDFKKNEKKLKEIFAQVSDIVTSKNMNNNQNLIKYNK